MNQQFTVGQVIVALAIVLGSAIGVYLVIILYRVSESLKRINGILDTNKQNIDNTLNSIPGIVENVNEITGSIRKKTTLLDELFNGKEEADSGSALGGIENLISSITGLISLVSEIKGFFGEKKRKIFKVKKR